MAKKQMKSTKKRVKKASPPKRRAAARKPAAKRAAPIPQGLRTITPSLVFKDTAKAIDFYKEAFGAKEISRMQSPDGRGIWHAQIKIGDSSIFMNDESPQTSTRAPSPSAPATASIQIYVPNCDKLFERALQAGGKTVMPMMDMFWGDRMGVLTDPFGNIWAVSTHVQDLTRAQMRKAGEEFARNMAAATEPAQQMRSDELHSSSVQAQA